MGKRAAWVVEQVAETAAIDPTILVYSRRPDEFAGWLEQHHCPGTILRASSAAEAEVLLERVDILMPWGFPTELLGRMPRLRWVQAMGAGVDDLLAAPTLPEQVVLTRIVGQFGGVIAEYVLAELLASVRRLAYFRRCQAERRWAPARVGTLAGRTLGVAGLGSIGLEIVRKARAFDMAVHGLSRSGAEAASVDVHFSPTEWRAFAAGVDALVLALPLTPHTESIVDADVLAAMQPDALLVNVGRGRLVDEAALVAALRAETLGGAVLDVFQQEPLDPQSPLWDLPNVVVTPHISGPSRAADTGRFFLENLERFRRHEPLVGLVDRKRGY